LIESFRHIPINTSFARSFAIPDLFPEEVKQLRQETPLCRVFGCKKEDVFLGTSVSQIADEHGTFYATEDYETTCLRCFKIFGYKSIAAVRKQGYKPKN